VDRQNAEPVIFGGTSKNWLLRPAAVESKSDVAARPFLEKGRIPSVSMDDK
jgi:hypothetical protein